METSEADSWAIPDGVVDDVAPAERARVRLTAISGFVGGMILVVAWFLPWIAVPEAKRPAVANAIERDLAEVRRRNPELAEKYRVIVDAVRAGRLTGLDCFHYLRTSWALNRLYVGEDPLDGRPDRAWRIQRTFLAGAVLVIALPAVALVLALHFAAHAFRRARSPVMIAMMVVGCGAGALALSWMRFAESVSLETAAGRTESLEVFTGLGLKATLVAGVVMTCAGIFGVTSRNWWRVYVGFLATLAALGVLTWAYVVWGTTP